MIGIRNAWYAGCASSRLRGRPLASRILDRDLVLFRDEGGRARALLDRCCHRGVKLSRGRIVDGSVACGYHGWRFDGSGSCVEIPSLTGEQRIPAGTCVPSFPCEERDGYVWVFVGEGPPGPPPEIPELAGRRFLQGSAFQGFGWIKGIENNLDVCHPAFAHPWTHPQWYLRKLRGAREVEMETRITPTGLVVFGPPAPSARAPIPDDLHFRLELRLPDRVTVRIGRRLVVIYHFVPVAENACRLEWLTTNPLPGPKLLWRRREPLVPRQDRRLLESAQPWYDALGGDFERSVEGDVPTLLARRIVDLASEGLWEDKRDTLPQRRLFRARI
jgi:phenylpropionate dioxygenase-like ring-hydroxylating dioxygenase large terminal subunit